MSNLNKIVRTDVKRLDEDVDYNPQSVSGHVSMKDMGSRIEHEPKAVEKMRDNKNSTKKKSTKISNQMEINNIGTIEDLSYYPTTEENAEILNQIMIKVHNKLTDASHDTIVSATDVVLELLKNDELEVSQKRQEIDQLLDDKVSDIELNELINLAKSITDYNQGDDNDDNEDETRPIVFEDEDEDEEENEGPSGDEADTEEEQVVEEEQAGLPTAQEHINEGLDDLAVIKQDSAMKKQADNEEPGRKRKFSEPEEANEKVKLAKIPPRKPKIVNLDDLVFDQGSHLMATTKVKLPKGSYQQNKKLYDIVSVPAPEIPQEVKDASSSLVPITDLPSWAQQAFPSNETSTLNVIQSKIYPLVFKSDENLLLCAPTGAGKTNVAMLAILRTIENFRSESGQIHLNDFKMVYIAPLKALVQEQMREFQRRLTANYGIVVNQLSGDSNLTKQEIMETQLLVVTPEKWDVITRKSSDVSYTNLVRLIIIDEIHLLHDERGPVLESIVSRTLRQTEEANSLPVRLIGLSATLPNYEDVARFLRVDFNTGLFYFDSSYRPCPLEQQFIGIKEKKAIKKLAAMNEACYDKLMDCINGNHQMIIFVHSRKDTFKTANWLKQKLESEEKLDKVLSASVGVKEILKQESELMTNKNLQEVLPTGFGIHHAGLNKNERTVVEDLFAQGHLRVLVSTATLAWGVNLPAHTVVIKGTETYSPDKGTWVQLSPQDILQMLGRAGRPRYDKSGEGVIITSQDEIQYYLAILNQQLPIESQLMGKLADNINAEVVLGTISSLQEAVSWLGYTYLYIRMLKSPALYHVGADYKGDDILYYKRMDLAHSALTILQNNKLIQYDNSTEEGFVRPTELGRIASHYYINYHTMNMYNSRLKPWLTEIDILGIFASSGEFKYIPLRQEERLEVAKLSEKCPIPIREDPTDPLTKVNVLLQSYISRLGLEGFALMADMIYITQSAGRLLRALHEISLRKNWSETSKITLNLCKMVEKRMWLTNSPLRQFGSIASKEIIKATETSHLPFVSYFNLSPEGLAEAINLKGSSKKTYELLQQFPKLSLSSYIQPLTHNSLRVQVEVTPDWDWNSSVHGNFQQFLILVENCNGESILYRDQVSIQKMFERREVLIEFTVPISDPVEPNYFVTFINDRWLHSEFKIPLMISDLKIPKKAPSFTKLLNIENVPTKELKVPEFIDTFEFEQFNKFQSQVFQSLFYTNDNTFIGMSKGCGKTTCAELAFLNHWKQNKGRVIYISPNEEQIQRLCKLWSKKYAAIGKEQDEQKDEEDEETNEEGGKKVDKLTGELSSDLRKLSSNHLVLSTPEQFDYLTRRWRQRKVVQTLELVVFDDVHTLSNGSDGVSYENVIARMKLVSTQVDHHVRFVALSSSLANGRDFGDYLGCPKQSIYNFNPTERFRNIKEIRIQSSNFNDNQALILNTIKPAYKFLKQSTGQGRSIVFAAGRKQCLEIALGISQYADLDNWSLLRCDVEAISNYLAKLKDSNLRDFIETKGIAYYYKGMDSVEKLVVERLFENDLLAVLVSDKDCASYCPTGNNVIVLGTEEYDGKEHRYNNYSVNSVLEMVGCCADKMNEAKALIYTKNSTMNHYNKFLNEGLPLESYYNVMMHDVFNTEVSTRTFKTRQDCIDWLTFTYFYRRLQLNPSFYDVKDTSHLGISEYLSDLVEKTINDLVENGLIELEDEEEKDDEDDEEENEEILSPLNGALIASHYNVLYDTMVELKRVDNKTKLRGILETICSASEFEELPIRLNETTTLERIYSRLPVKSASGADFESPYFKAFILLQAHFSRVRLPVDLMTDLKFILKKVVRVICACIDLLSSEGYLNAMQAIDLSQMVVQGLWNRDSPLKQIPNINDGILARCKKYNVETVYDIMSLEDDERDDVLQLEGTELEQVAEFVNKYPNVDISYEPEDLTLSPIVADEPTSVRIYLERDEEMDDLSVVAPFFPDNKREEWWIIIGDKLAKQLYGIKKTTIAKENQTIEVEMTIPNAGTHGLTIWCMCDSYLDADKEIGVEVKVVDN